ncbi:NAD(P)-binding protein [Hymenopellis radicata]|nr:NAD(P)-binding protein [Hymenopellis radicata]
MASGGVAAALSDVKPTETVLSLFSLTDRVAMVTGAHRGIGLESALALAEAGAIVYCIDLPVSPDESWLKVQRYAATEVPGSAKGRLEYIRGDATDQKAIWAIAEEIVAKEGRLDICVCCAGVLGSAPCLDYSAEDFEKLMKVNVNGVLFSSQAAGRQMRRLGTPGSIIIIGSIAGTIANQDLPWIAYHTSKSAVLQMTRSLACELAPHHIRVNSLSPGYIDTVMTGAFLASKPELRKAWESQNPMGRMGKPEELRGAILWLAGNASTFCTGSNIMVDGGHSAW